MTSANFWLDTCKVETAADGLCIGYIKAMHDMNEMLTHVFKRPLWCSPDGVTINQLRLIIMSDLTAKPAELHHPFAGLATFALANSFPCPQYKAR